MKRYTIWKVDDSKWILETEDDALGEYIKTLTAKETSVIGVERFGVGINTPLRVFMIADEEVLNVEKILETWIRRHASE